MTPEQRVMRARLAALTRWSRTDSVEGTAAARKASVSRFERQVDPDGVLPLAERRRRAAAAQKAFMTAMSLKASQARSNRQLKNTA